MPASKIDLRENALGTGMADLRNRPWLRFSMRAALGAMTLAAVASWIYWDGWGRYSAWRERLRFEAALMQIDGDFDRAGDALRSTGKLSSAFKIWANGGGWIASEWPTVTYFLFFPPSTSRHAANALEVYRLPNAPESYTPQFGSRTSVLNLRTSNRMETQDGYWRDCYEFLRGDRQGKPAIEFELIRVVPAQPGTGVGTDP